MRVARRLSQSRDPTLLYLFFTFHASNLKWSVTSMEQNALSTTPSFTVQYLYFGQEVKCEEFILLDYVVFFVCFVCFYIDQILLHCLISLTVCLHVCFIFRTWLLGVWFTTRRITGISSLAGNSWSLIFWQPIIHTHRHTHTHTDTKTHSHTDTDKHT